MIQSKLLTDLSGQMREQSVKRYNKKTHEKIKNRDSVFIWPSSGKSQERNTIMTDSFKYVCTCGVTVGLNSVQWMCCTEYAKHEICNNGLIISFQQMHYTVLVFLSLHMFRHFLCHHQGCLQEFTILNASNGCIDVGTKKNTKTV
jgi:hypothetical protein